VNPLEDVAEPTLAKPRLRGLSHCLAFFAALAGWAMLVRAGATTRALVAGNIYGASLAVMFGVSGRFLRRLDHAAIFVLIAGTYTPLCLALEPSRGLALLAFVATGAAFGVVKAIVFPDAPRYVGLAIYLGLGWAVFPLVATLRAAVGAEGLALVAVGGVAYSAGALVYGIRRPDPIPTVFGYYEVFHLLVIAAAACHFAVVLPVVRGLR
jgi:hemolysin III